MNLFEAVAEGARADRPALRSGAAALDYGNLIELVETTSRLLVEAGAAPGERIVVLLPNGIEHVIALLAVGVTGAIAVPCDPQAGALRRTQVVEETSPRLCLLAPEASAPSGCRSAHFEIDLAARAPRLSKPEGEAPSGAAATGSGDAALIRFTSGSTGRPKGVVLAHEQLVSTARTLAEVFGFGAEHRELAVTPMSHSGGWQRVASTLLAGGCLAIGEEPFLLAGMLEELRRLEITGFFAPPPLIRMLLAAEHKSADALAGCRSLEVGSAALGAAELARLLEIAPAARVFVHYGLTECSRALILDARAHPGKLDSVGRPAPGVELEIRAEDGTRLGAGESGQVFLRGPQRTRGYWRRPDLDAERLAGGWLATGDYGRLDHDGFLRLLGRRDERIESAGYSFFPAEVEAELGPVEGVEQYLIAGVPDPRGVLGEVPWAFVVPRDPAGPFARAFAEQARRRLPPYMVPRRVLSVPFLPLTASGKPDRRAAIANHAGLADPDERADGER